MPVDFTDYDSDEDKDDNVPADEGRRLSREDLQDLAKVGSDLFRRTILSGVDMFREASKDLPKEATQFISSRKEQVLKNVSKDMAQLMVSSALENVFALVRDHRLEVSFRIVKNTVAESEQEDASKKSSADSGPKSRSKGQPPPGEKSDFAGRRDTARGSYRSESGLSKSERSGTMARKTRR